MGTRPAVFLDRDGVLNRAVPGVEGPLPPRGLDDFRLLPGVAEACGTLAGSGLLLIVVTNQPDLARGTQDHAVVQAMHTRLLSWLPLTEVLVCPHDDDDGCWCRKPRPGLVLDAARRHDVDLDRSVLVGDRWRDVQCAHRAGIGSVLVDWGHGEPLRDTPDARFGSLRAAVDHVLSRTAAGAGSIRDRLAEGSHHHHEDLR